MSYLQMTKVVLSLIVSVTSPFYVSLSSILLLLLLYITITTYKSFLYSHHLTTPTNPFFDEITTPTNPFMNVIGSIQLSNYALKITYMLMNIGINKKLIEIIVKKECE